jgi:signal transduction histidine kinase
LSALARFRRASRGRPRRFQAVLGIAAAVLAGSVRTYPLTAGSALSVWAESFIVAVTSLIAGWLGSAVLLLFLTVVTFAASGTLAVAFLSAARNLAIGGFCVLVIVAGRRMAGALHERNRLRRRIVVYKQRTLFIRNHVARLRRAVLMRERALRAREAELSQAISSHQSALAELKRARHLVDAAQRSSGHFVAMMSHEIRTPLHGLMATIDMLRDEPLSPEGRHRVGIARVSARTLLNIANDILDLSRIDAGAFPLEHKPFDLANVLREVVHEARVRAQSLGLELRAVMEGRPGGPPTERSGTERTAVGSERRVM